MRINESDFNYFDAIENSIELDTQIAIAEMTLDFRHWLVDNGYLLEAATDSNKDYMQWKVNKSNAVKNNVARVIQYATQQAAKNNMFLERNREIILNSKRFPVKPGNDLKNAPNYMMALQRISAPVSATIGSLNLAKVDAENGPQSNGALKQTLIHSYREGDFVQFAKAYYYGADNKRINMDTNQVTSLLQTAFQYCYQYPARMRGVQTDAQGIISYINKDPSTGQVDAATQSDLSALRATQMQNAAQNMNRASTNPYRNAGQVNADTNYELFFGDHFKDLEPLDEADVTKPENSKTTVNDKQTATTAKNTSQSPNGAPVDTKALVSAKHKTACEIIEDCFNAKITAMGMLYRDFIFILRNHVASYKGVEAGNEGQNQQPTAPTRNNQAQLAPNTTQK